MRFFNIFKNKNAPFFEVFTSVNLKKVRFFSIFVRKVVQEKIISIWQYSSWRTFSSNITKKRTFFKFTLEYIPKKGAFLFFSTLKNRTFFSHWNSYPIEGNFHFSWNGTISLRKSTIWSLRLRVIPIVRAKTPISRVGDYTVGNSHELGAYKCKYMWKMPRFRGICVKYIWKCPEFVAK